MWNHILQRWGLLSFSPQTRRQRRQRQRQRRSSFAVAAAEAAVPRPETARDISSLSPPQEEEQRVDRRTNPPPAPPLHRTLEQRAPPPLTPPIPLSILPPLIVTLSPTIIHCTSSSPPSPGRCHSHPNDIHRSDFRFQLRDYGGGGVTPPRLYDHRHNQYDHRPSVPPPPLPRVNPVLPTDHAVTRRDRPLTPTITPTNNSSNTNNHMRGRSRSQPPPLPEPPSRNVSQKKKKKKIRSFWLTADLYHSIQWLQRENVYIIGSIVHQSTRALFLQESWSCVVQSSSTSSIASTSLQHSSIYLQTLPYFIAHTVPRGQYTEQWVCQYIMYPLCQILHSCHHTCRMIHGNLHLHHILIHPLTYQMSICGLQYAIPLPSSSPTTTTTSRNGTSPSSSPPVVMSI
jgi:hypothetical protein